MPPCSAEAASLNNTCMFMVMHNSIVCMCVVLKSISFSTAPSPPRMLIMTGAPTGSTVELNWIPPLHPNGAIHYEIEYELATASGDPVNAGSSSSPYFTLTLPNEFQSYNVRVAAVNSQGRANSNVLLVMCSAAGRGKVYYCEQLVFSQTQHFLIIPNPNPA